MTIVGYILMTVVSHTILREPSVLATTQVLLPPTANCEQVALDLLQRKIATNAYCIPVYAQK